MIRGEKRISQINGECPQTAYEAADESAHFFMIHYPEAIAEDVADFNGKNRLEIPSMDYLDLS